MTPPECVRIALGHSYRVIGILFLILSVWVNLFNFRIELICFVNRVRALHITRFNIGPERRSRFLNCGTGEQFLGDPAGVEEILALFY